MGCCSSNEKSCACACHSQQKKYCCSCHSKHSEYSHEEKGSEGKGGYFLKLADEAWEEVLKDKIKEYILNTQDERMTKLAKIVAEGNNHRWRNSIEKEHGCKKFQEEMYEFFGQNKK